MSAAPLLLPALLVVTLVVQALLPSRRLLVVTSGAALACLAATLLGVSTTPELLGDVPWDVLVILVALGLLSSLLGASRVFDRLAVAATEASRADPRRVLLVFASGMYVVSGLVNNLTALLLVLPVLLVLLRLSGLSQRYFSWTLGVLLVACNLGGAATPIGDFPAILLLGGGRMAFADYLVRAGPATLLALLVLLAAVRVGVRPAASVPRDPVSTRLARAIMAALHRNVTVDRRVLVPAGLSLAAMIVAWLALPASLGIGPELVCWLGAGVALVACAARGEALLRRAVDVEAVLFLLSLFVMVAAVGRTGFFAVAADRLAALPLAPSAQLAVFLVLAGVLTGLFSAGPSMAALLAVADSLATRLPPSAVYVGLALSVCAGSSLFLTAATSGPLAQGLAERAGLADLDGRPLRFGFREFLPTGLLSFAVIQAVALAFAAFELWRAG